MSWKLIPETYQPDTVDTRKDNPQIKYVKMYSEDYVKKLAVILRQTTESLHAAISNPDLNSEVNRGTQRACIPVLKKAYEFLKEVEDK